MKRIRALLAIALIALTSSAMAVTVNFQFAAGVSDFAKQAAENSGKSVAMKTDESGSNNYAAPLSWFRLSDTLTLTSGSGSVKITTLGISDGIGSIDPGSCTNSAVLNTKLGSMTKVIVKLDATTSGDVSVTSCDIESSSSATNISSTDLNTAQ